MNCPACTRRSDDGLLCTSCTDRLKEDLTLLPIYMAELSTTYLRQAHTGDGSGGKTHEEPLPYNHDAATVRDSVINTVGTWIRELSLGDDVDLAPNIRAWCRWLHDRAQRMRGHVAAEEICDEIHYAVGIVRAAIDRAAESTYCGKCDVCSKDLHASPDAPHAVCRYCYIGGRENSYPIPGRRANDWKLAADKLLTRAQVLEALIYLRLEVNAATFRSWIHRGALKPEDYQKNGAPLYRLRTVQDLANQVRVSVDRTA